MLCAFILLFEFLFYLLVILFSVFIIAMTIFYEHPGAGVLLGIIGLLLGIVRVLVGVHEPKDIIVGALAGIVCGIVGYYVI